MIGQFDNKVISSFALWLDHELINRGQAYQNVKSLFYNTNSIYNNYYVYSSPYSQIMGDSSISGANIITGIYLNNVPIGTGQNNFHGIDLNNGRLYFTSPVTGTISGNYAVKDFNVYLTNRGEDELLFDTKYSSNPKIPQTLTGLNNELTLPAIFIRNDGGLNNPFAFGGTDNTFMNVRVIILTDSQFLLDASTSIIRDLARKIVPLIELNQMPFNLLNEPKTGVYNYNNLILNSTNFSFIDQVLVTRMSESVKIDINNLPRNVYAGFANFELFNIRDPHIDN